MSFLETPRFPTTISYGSKGGPHYNTTIIQVSSGYEKRNQNWTYPLHMYDAAFGVQNQSDLDSLIEFFHAVNGPADGFRFKDFADYRTIGADAALSVAATDQNIGTGDASTVAFQLRKQYIKGANTTNRIITKPVSGTVLIAVNSVTQTETTDYTIDYATGIVTFNVAPGMGLAVTWGGEFDVPCRFGEDSLEVSLDSFNIGSASVPIVEIRI